ncbi:MAG: flavin reductase family protein [Oscillospiraceae bacterium]|jgi:flavin reductase (DIM6/NTAB) family NADH-FMN oxidoreductase RutF|nr:flavin reductase family protein [Oscillospiraceae bacterium]
MEKVNFPISNAFCPQSLFLYGTYKENGEPNYGLFCWATYCWNEGFRFVACIGEDKLTRDRIRAAGIFSASLVSERLLPLADYCGNNAGYTVDKSRTIASEKGSVLEVPIPELSPVSFELRVDKTLHLDERGSSEIYICDIVNVRADERLADESIPLEARLHRAAPVVTTTETYYSIAPTPLGRWGQWGTSEKLGK